MVRIAITKIVLQFYWVDQKHYLTMNISPSLLATCVVLAFSGVWAHQIRGINSNHISHGQNDIRQLEGSDGTDENGSGDTDAVDVYLTKTSTNQEPEDTELVFEGVGTGHSAFRVTIKDEIEVSGSSGRTAG